VSGTRLPLQHPTVTTTADLAPGLLLRISIEDGFYHVTDMIGTRYGFGCPVGDALAQWWEQVNDIISMDEPLGDPLKSEVYRYRKALGHV
jgi:hypothetical protein